MDERSLTARLRPVCPRATEIPSAIVIGGRMARYALAIAFLLSVPSLALGQNDNRSRGATDAGPRIAPPAAPRVGAEVTEGLVTEGVRDAVSPGGLTSSLKLMLLLTVLSLAPSILLMTTCFVRFAIVLGLLRQALGTQQLPPNQVITSLCLFLTLMVMSPYWSAAYEQGIKPYTNGLPIETADGGHLPPGASDEEKLTQSVANTIAPLQDFMIAQIRGTKNTDTIFMLLEFKRPTEGSAAASSYVEPENFEDVPLSVLLPAYMLSELKTAFVIGFQIYLPFIVIDMVIATVLISMGMMMLPPVLISLPFKLLLFVLIDGWALTVGMMLTGVMQFN